MDSLLSPAFFTIINGNAEVFFAPKLPSLDIEDLACLLFIPIATTVGVNDFKPDHHQMRHGIKITTSGTFQGEMHLMVFLHIRLWRP